MKKPHGVLTLSLPFQTLLKRLAMTPWWLTLTGSSGWRTLTRFLGVSTSTSLESASRVTSSLSDCRFRLRRYWRKNGWSKICAETKFENVFSPRRPVKLLNFLAWKNAQNVLKTLPRSNRFLGSIHMILEMTKRASSEKEEGITNCPAMIRRAVSLKRLIIHSLGDTYLVIFF